jgi:hypothetical protein
MQRGIKSKASKVDYRLLYKKQILDLLESIKNINTSVWQLNKNMEKLFEFGDYVVPVCLSKLREGDEELAAVICYALEYVNDFSLVEPLMEMLILPNISDKIKARIISVLIHYGIDASELPISAIIKDFDKIAQDSLLEMLDDINEDYFLIPYILEDFEEFPSDMKIVHLRDIGNQKNEKAIPLLEIIASINDVAVAQEAVKALGKIKSGKSLFVLNKIINKHENDIVKKVAFRESQRLKFSGVQLEVEPLRLKLGEPKKIILSSIDGLGSRTLWIAWKNPIVKRRLCCMNVLINTELGIKDCWGISQITTREFNSSVKELSRSTVVTECEMDYALLLLRNALYCNQQNNVDLPYQFYFWKHLLQQQYNLNPMYYKPVFEGYDLKAIAENEEYIKETYNLLNYKLYSDWFIANPKVYDYAEQNRSKKGYMLKKMTYQKSENFFIKFTQELIQPHIEILERMLELSADFLVKAGQRELAEIALAALLNIGKIPLHQHPFFQRMAVESLKVALNNMKNGFDLRINPDIFD